MAARPLLLTLLIALGHGRRGTGERDPLPLDRTELLEQATALFVERWLFRIRKEAPEDIPDELTTGHLRHALEILSLAAQEQRRPAQVPGPGPDQDQGADDPAAQGQAEVDGLQFIGAVAEALGKSLYARIEPAKDLLRERAGLLFQRGPGEQAPYGFVHRLFQEYLAACELVRRHAGGEREDDLALRLGRELNARPGTWREVARFAVVHLARPRTGPGDLGPAGPGSPGPRPAEAVAVLHRLLGGCHDANPVGPTRWEGLAVAALALQDLELALTPEIGREWGLDAELADVKRHLDGWYLRLTREPGPTPRTRLDFGRVAGRLGDPRPYVVPAAWTPDPRAPFALDPDRDFDWVEIPAGRFRPGSDPEETQAADENERAEENELNGEPVDLAAFRIARYPVTQAQFAAFVRAADGYGQGVEPPPCWRFARDARAGNGPAGAGEDAAVPCGSARPLVGFGPEPRRRAPAEPSGH
jgi:hypothetical protein